jgi:hypothetical protein
VRRTAFCSARIRHNAPGIALILTVVTVALTFGMPVVPASATCFSGEQAIFTRHVNKYVAYGTTNELWLYDRDLALNCGGDPEGWYTAHMEPGPTPGSLDEIGPAEQPCTIGNPGGPHCYYLFTEGVNNGTVRCQHHVYHPSQLHPFDWAKYRVVNITLNGNSNYWGWRVDWEDGGGFISYGHCLGLSDHGKARNETGRSGGTGTGMKTFAQTVTFQGSGGSWVDWTTVCDDDPVGGWQVNVHSGGSAFDVDQGSGNCTFTPP